MMSLPLDNSDGGSSPLSPCSPDQEPEEEEEEEEGDMEAGPMSLEPPIMAPAVAAKPGTKRYS